MGLTILFGLVVFGVGALLWRMTQLPAVPLGNGIEVRVLKVSTGTRHFYSEDKGWRRFAAETLPDEWLTRIGVGRSVFTRPHGSLVLWVTEVDGNTRGALRPTIDSGFVEFGDGHRSAPGLVSAIKSNVTQIEFPIYPRADSQIKIQLREAGGQAVFKIKNPQPVKPERWDARGLPQTNFSPTCAIVLAGDVRNYLSLQTRDRNGGRLGWLYYRIEIRDTVGNVEDITGNGGQVRNFAEHTYQPGPLKITVHPREYISAGYVTNRAPGTVQEMELSERSAQLGMEKLFFLGAGDYLFANGIPNQTKDPLSPNVTMTTTNDGSNWTAHIAPQRPTLAALYPVTVNVESFDARLRERTQRGNGGNLFQSYRPPQESRSFPTGRLLRVFDIPSFRSTNAIEAEVIARHRPVEFVVDPQIRN